ncbi:hypothetical protein [Microcoleus sp. B13-B6]
MLAKTKKGNHGGILPTSTSQILYGLCQRATPRTLRSQDFWLRKVSL